MRRFPRLAIVGGKDVSMLFSNINVSSFFKFPISFGNAPEKKTHLKVKQTVGMKE